MLRFFILKLLNNQIYIDLKKNIKLPLFFKNFNNKTIKLKKIFLFVKDYKFQLGYPYLKFSSLILKILKINLNKKSLILKTKPKKKFTKLKGNNNFFIKGTFIN